VTPISGGANGLLRSDSLPAQPVQHNLLPGRVITNWLFLLCQTTVLPYPTTTWVGVMGSRRQCIWSG
jgi:hypothetical protein